MKNSRPLFLYFIKDAYHGYPIPNTESWYLFVHHFPTSQNRDPEMDEEEQKVKENGDC